MPDAPDRSNAKQLGAMSAEELAQRAGDGSMPCFVELLGRFEARVYNFVLRRVGCAADAEDLTQETFVRAWQHMNRYKPRHRFSTWLFTIAGRLTVDFHRARRLRPSDAHALREIGRRDQPDRTHGEIAAVAEPDGASLWSLAACVLSREQHAALWLRYAEDLDTSAIARVLGRTPISVRVMLMRARRVLGAHAGLASRQTVLEARAGIDRGVSCSTP
jgi:RNA polymerase sigma-70 factor (ECF subfamily)